MKKIPLFLVAVLILVVAAAGGAYLYKKGYPQKIAPAPAAGLPVSMDNPAVTSATVSYNFTGVIKTVETTADGASLTLVSQAGALPTFSVTKNTRIFTSVQKISTPGAVSDLKSSAKVTVAASYDFKRKVWNTTVVFLIPDTTK